MKIVEALKRLRVIEKRIVSNQEEIGKYASSPSTERPVFGSDEEQKAAVNALIQSSKDLWAEYMSLKQRVDKTNLNVKVDINGEEYTISELLMIKRKGAPLMVKVYQALNDNKTKLKVDRMTAGPDGKRPFTVRYYNETDRNEGIRKWDDLYHTIDSRLEIINATTELLD